MSATEKRQQAAFLADIGRGLAQLHTRYYGKGPTKARTYHWGELVVVLLSGGFTRAMVSDSNAHGLGS